MTRWMLRLAFALGALLGLAPLARANQPFYGWCEIGGQNAVTSGLLSTNTLQASYPGCTITVYVHGGASLATLYSDNNSPPTPLANPFTASATTGYFEAYAPNGRYDVTLTGGGLPSPVTYSDIVLNDAFSPGGLLIGSFLVVPYASPAVFSASAATVQQMTLTANVTSSSITNATAGQYMSIEICQNATGGFSFAWPSNVLLAPTVTTTPNACTLVSLVYDGTNWYASSGGGGGGLNFENGGSPIGSATTFNCGTNTTCTLVGGVVTIVASSTAGTAFSSLTSGITSNSGTFGGSGNTWDFSAALAFKVPSVSSLTAVNEIGYETSTDGLHFYYGNGLGDLPIMPLSGPLQSGDCLRGSLIDALTPVILDSGSAACATWATLPLSGTNTGTGMVLAPSVTTSVPFTLDCPGGSLDCFDVEFNGTIGGWNFEGEFYTGRTTPATSTSNIGSPLLLIEGNYWNGSTSAVDGWSISSILGPGANPESVFEIGHATGSTGPTEILLDASTTTLPAGSVLDAYTINADQLTINPGATGIVPLSVTLPAGLTVDGVDFFGSSSATGSSPVLHVEAFGSTQPTLQFDNGGVAQEWIGPASGGNAQVIFGVGSTTINNSVSSAARFNFVNNSNANNNMLNFSSATTPTATLSYMRYEASPGSSAYFWQAQVSCNADGSCPSGTTEASLRADGLFTTASESITGLAVNSLVCTSPTTTLLTTSGCPGGSGGGGGIPPNVLGFTATIASNVMTIGGGIGGSSACSTTTPCNVRVGNVVTSFTTVATATISGTGSGSAISYITATAPSTLVVLYQVTSGSYSISCTNCTATTTSSTPAFPANSVPIASVQVGSDAFSSLVQEQSGIALPSYVADGSTLGSTIASGITTFSVAQNLSITSLTLTGLANNSIVCTSTGSALLTTSGCPSSGGGSAGVNVYTTNHTLGSSDNNAWVEMNCTASCTLTIPATQPSTTFSTRILSIGSTVATIAIGGSDTFNGQTSVPVLNSFRPMSLQADSTTSTNYVGDAPLVAGTNVTFSPSSNGFSISASAVGLSGMTAGQVPIAASATTVTSSKALAGSGAGIVTGPTTATSGDVAEFTGANGQIADSSVALSSLAPLASPTFTGTVTTPNLTLSGLTSTPVLATGSGGAIQAATATGISDVLQGLTGCSTSGYVLTPQANDCINPSPTLFYFSNGPANSTQALSSTANEYFIALLRITTVLQFSHIYFDVSTDDSSHNYDIGIYSCPSNDCSQPSVTATLVCDFGTGSAGITLTTTGAYAESCTQTTPITIQPGTYILARTGSGTAAQVQALTGTVGPLMPFSTNQPGTTSSGQLPSSFTTPTAGATGSGQPPVMALH